jgi:poly(3-hydroxybutyrate) depolymerase
VVFGLKVEAEWGGAVGSVDLVAALGSVDDPAHLQRMRAWVLAEGADPVVGPAVVKAAWSFLHHYSGERAHFEQLAGAGHSMPTAGRGSACGTTQAPYVNDCGFDAAGRMLDDLYPDAPAGQDERPGGQLGEAAGLLRFDQSGFVSGWRRITGRTSMDPVGFLYVPGACRRGGCRLHIAFHGCRQGASLAGPAFVRDGGYNEWAGRHATVVLYPQVRPIVASWRPPWLPLNPEGCWDWWGYSGADYAVRSGAQIEAVFGMVERLLGPVVR